MAGCLLASVDQPTSERIGKQTNKQGLGRKHGKSLAGYPLWLARAGQAAWFHPHCHQRAEGPVPDGLPSGTSATMELLGSCGYEVELMDTGCCGMAGTFGYEAEHYDVSMKVGELKLFPALAPLVSQSGMPFPNSNLASAGEGLVVSSGAACRDWNRRRTPVSTSTARAG